MSAGSTTARVPKVEMKDDCSTCPAVNAGAVPGASTR
jgi:hypothetical protein